MALLIICIYDRKGDLKVIILCNFAQGDSVYKFFIKNGLYYLAIVILISYLSYTFIIYKLKLCFTFCFPARIYINLEHQKI